MPPRAHGLASLAKQKVAKFRPTSYQTPVTYSVSGAARERCTQRAKRKAQRALARSSAKNALVGLIDELRKEEPPDWYTQEQDVAWREELEGQRRRLIGSAGTNIQVWSG